MNTVCAQFLDWSSLVSAFIGGLLALFAVFFADWLAKRKEKENRREEIQALIQSIKDEVGTLWGIYMNSAGKSLEELGESNPFNRYFPVTQEYFTVYTSNAHKIGMIHDETLRKSIVETYSLGRSLIDTYRFNNELVRRCDNNAWMFHITKIPVYDELLKSSEKDLVEYSSSLKSIHMSFKEKVNKLLQELSEYKA